MPIIVDRATDRNGKPWNVCFVADQFLRYIASNNVVANGSIKRTAAFRTKPEALSFIANAI